MAFFLTDRDPELTRAIVGRDPIGILPVWTYRARDLVPHLSSASSRIEGFQVLFSILALWPEYVAAHPEHQKSIRTFFILTEQAFARASWAVNQDWPLPGRQRLERGTYGLQISQEATHHLTQSQLTNGVWGIYRGAAERAGLLTTGTEALSPLLQQAVREGEMLDGSTKRQLFNAVATCIDDDRQAVSLAARSTTRLVQALARTVRPCPLESFLRGPLLNPPGCALTTRIGRKLEAMSDANWQKIDYRGFLGTLRGASGEDRQALDNVIRCEQFLAPLESLFLWLCSQSGTRLSTAAANMPLDIGRFHAARVQFSESGMYEQLAQERHQRYVNELRGESAESLLTSLLEIHRTISDERAAEPWVHVDETGQLCANVEVTPPGKADFDPGFAWRNDYYLGAFGNLVRQVGYKGVLGG